LNSSCRALQNDLVLWENFVLGRQLGSTEGAQTVSRN
jgi:hypothetical protein